MWRDASHDDEHCPTPARTRALPERGKQETVAAALAEIAQDMVG